MVRGIRSCPGPRCSSCHGGRNITPPNLTRRWPTSRDGSDLSCGRSPPVLSDLIRGGGWGAQRDATHDSTRCWATTVSVVLQLGCLLSGQQGCRDLANLCRSAGSEFMGSVLAFLGSAGHIFVASLAFICSFLVSFAAV